MKLYLLSALTVFGLMISCSNAKELEPDVETDINTPQEENVIDGILVTDMGAYSSDPLGILNVVVEKDLMRVTVKYSGGCQEHGFELVGLKMISKSIPPQRSIKIFHTANGDDCRELIEETIVFDISTFAIGNGEVTLHLDGWGTPLSYLPAQ